MILALEFKLIEMMFILVHAAEANSSTLFLSTIISTILTKVLHNNMARSNDVHTIYQSILNMRNHGNNNDLLISLTAILTIYLDRNVVLVLTSKWIKKCQSGMLSGPLYWKARRGQR